MDKNTKNKAKIVKVPDMNNDKLTVDERIAITELHEKRDRMIADRDKKLKSAKEQLVESLKVTVDKYRTATGTAEALRILRFVTGNDVANLVWANRLAWDMAVETDKMKQKAEKLTYTEMDHLCEGYYDKEFKVEYPRNFSDNEISSIEEEHCYNLAFEMMRIDLCRNVGPAAEDMVAFIDRISEEIQAIDDELATLETRKEA